MIVYQRLSCQDNINYFYKAIGFLTHFLSFIFLRQLRGNNINRKMLKLPQIKNGKQVISNSSASILKESIVTTASYQNHQQMTPRGVQKIEKSHLLTKKITNSSSTKESLEAYRDTPRVQQLKTLNLTKIKECVNEIGIFVNTYRLMENDELNCKKNLFQLFHQIQTIFLAAIRIEPLLDIKNTKKPVQLKNVKGESLSNQIKTLPLKKMNNPQENNIQMNILKAQVEEHRKTNIQCIQKIDQITNLLQILNSNYQNERKRNQILIQAINIYVHQTQCYLQKVANKQKDKTITQLERDIQQILIKLKFKTFDFHFTT